MQSRNIIRTFLFVIFSFIGATVLCGSIICDDLLGRYQLENQLKKSEELLQRLESLNTDYDFLLRQLNNDPNFIKRLAPATLGTEPADQNTVYPKATAEQLAAARKALAKQSDQETTEPTVPRWLVRCSEPNKRIILALAGALLVLTSFIFFCPARQSHSTP